MRNGEFNPLLILTKYLISLGVFLIILGVLLFLLRRIGLFQLPGDFLVRRKNFTFYFPLATSIIISILVTIFINLILSLRR